MTPDLLSIGQVAQTTGLAVSAVRYYDDIGLIEASARVGGKRRFAPEIVGRVSFVQRAQEAGFSLDEIGLSAEGRPDFSGLSQLDSGQEGKRGRG